MCAVALDLSKGENLDFAIYNLILQQEQAEFTEDYIVEQLKTYQGIPDEAIIERSVKNFLHFWVEKELLRQNWNRYSLV